MHTDACTSAEACPAERLFARKRWRGQIARNERDVFHFNTSRTSCASEVGGMDSADNTIGPNRKIRIDANEAPDILTSSGVSTERTEGR